MSDQAELSSQLTIKIDGQEVPLDVMTQVESVTVEQHSLLPDMFTIVLFDSEMEVLDSGPFDLTKKVEIAAEGADDNEVKLIEGEITALSPSFGEGMIARLVVEGYDRSHRLYRETKSAAYLNKKDSDLASEIARAAGLQAEVETTATVYDHIYQHNQSDLAFLRQRAARIGYEVFVEGEKLYFRKPPSGQGEETLIWGEDLKTFAPRMTLAEQVDEVVVRGWDVQRQEAIVGRAQTGSLYPNVQEQKNGAQWAGDFGSGKKVIVDHPVVSQAEADAIAAARLDELSGAFIEAEGEAFRRPGIRAGRFIELQGLGERFSGHYLVTSALHRYTPEGLQTTFWVRGSRTGTLGEQLGGKPDVERFPGVVTAVVTNTDDPNDWGRVKLKFPWMSEDAESDWARVIGSGAGPEAGLYGLPEVGDEVLVAFEQGDFSRPFVLGGLWNGQHDIPPEAAAAGSGEKPLVRTWRSRSGHWVAMHDTADDKVEIVSAGGHKFTLDDANKAITLETIGGLKLSLEDNGSKISLESGNEIELKSSGNMKIEASGNLDLKASGQVNVQGAMINLN